MKLTRPALLLAATLAAASLTACATTTPANPVDSTEDAAGDGHGDVDGAREVSDPPLALLSVDGDGNVGIIDLVESTNVAVGQIAEPTALASDGRYAFASTTDGLSVVDSGRWSWNHGDHFHYYLAEPRIVGTLPGTGEAVVSTGMLSTAGTTGVFYTDAGEAVLLDNAALSEGEIVEVFRVSTEPGAGVIAPLQDGAVVSIGDTLVYHDATGAPIEAAVPCTEPAGAITTVVGLAVSCAEGAVLATWEDGAPVFETIAYPSDTAAPRAEGFTGRKGRPVVSALAGDAGFWLFNTRAAQWQFVATDAPLALVTAAGDDAGHVVALDADGRVRVYAGDGGAELVATDVLVTEVGSSVSLTVDGQRAYLNDPAAGVVHEIDYADSARIARTIDAATAPLWIAEVGR